MNPPGPGRSGMDPEGEDTNAHSRPSCVSRPGDGGPLLAACSSDGGDSSNTSGAAATEAAPTSASTASPIPSSPAA